MKRAFKKVALVAVAIALVASQQAMAAERVAPVFKAGELTGRIADVTGAAVEETAIRLLDLEEQLVAEAVTDEKGAFKTEAIGEGEYVLAVGDSQKFAVSFTEDADASNLVLILPVEPSYQAAQVAPALGIPATAAAVGSGAVILAGGVIVSDDVSSSDNTLPTVVSP